MKIIKNLFGKNVDERQEKELMKIEHYGFWLFYWVLLFSILFQIMFLDAEFEQWAGEWSVFMLISLFEICACIRKGIWSYNIPKDLSIKQNIMYSLIGSVSFGVLFGVYHSIKAGVPDIFSGVLLTLITIAILFVALFLAYLLVGILIRIRRERLEKKEWSEEDE